MYDNATSRAYNSEKITIGAATEAHFTYPENAREGLLRLWTTGGPYHVSLGESTDAGGGIGTRGMVIGMPAMGSQYIEYRIPDRWRGEIYINNSGGGNVDMWLQWVLV